MISGTSKHFIPDLQNQYIEGMSHYRLWFLKYGN